MKQMFLFSTAFLYFVLHAIAATQCFYPDGMTVEPNHTPCNKTVVDSACCLVQDSCTASGLCLGTTNFNYRGSCTDKTWKSDACPQNCHQDPLSKKAYAATTPLISCGSPGTISNEFCCQSPGKDCCTIATFGIGSTGNAFSHGLDRLILELKDANSTSELISTPNQTSLSTDSSAKLPTTISIATTIGLAIGVLLGALSVGILGFLLIRENRQSKKQKISMRGIIVDTDKRAYFHPGPPPKPPVEVRKSSTWGSRTSTMRDTPIAPARSGSGTRPGGAPVDLR